MQKDLNNFNVFLTTLTFMLIFVIFQDFSRLFYYHGASHALRQFVEIMAPSIIALSIISGAAAISFEKFKKIKISYIIAGFIIQFFLILIFAMTGLLHFTLPPEVMSFDMIETPMSFFLKCQNTILTTTIAVTIFLKWLFDKDFRKLFIVDNEKADFVDYAQFFFLYIFVNACFSFVALILSKMIYYKILYISNIDLIILIIIEALGNMVIIFFGLAIIFILNYKNQFSFKNFIYLATFVNLFAMIFNLLPLFRNQNVVIDLYFAIKITIQITTLTFIETSTQLFCLWIIFNISNKFRPQIGHLS